MHSLSDVEYAYQISTGKRASNDRAIAGHKPTYQDESAVNRDQNWEDIIEAISRAPENCSYCFL
jgi:hypothetical protein